MSAFTGTTQLMKIGLRRDRFMIPIWVYALAASAIGTAFSYRGLYKTLASRLEFAAGVRSNGSTLALYGHVYSSGTVGGLTAWRFVGIGATLASILSVLLVVRHTRADEESGRLELVSSGAVGRGAPLAGGLLIAAVAQLTLAVLTMIGLTVVGQPWSGSVEFGLAWLGTALVFAAVAAVTAQLSESARAANTLAMSVLGAAYLLRAIGDAGPSWVSWLSPVGWAQQVRPYADDRWWVLAVPVAASAVLTAVAFRLAARRDVGTGLVPIRPGPAVGDRRLSSPLALAWRLQRATVVSWTVGFAIYGAAIGGIADGVGALVNSSSGTRDIIVRMGGRHGLIDAFLATVMGILGIAAAAFVVQSLLRLRSEESAQRAEIVLAGAVSRSRWVASHVVVAVSGSALMLAAGGLAAGITHGVRAHDLAGQLPRVLAGAVIQLPAVWVLAGAVLLLYGVLPRVVAAAAWALLGVFLLLGQLGPVLRLPGWALDASPFTHLPKLPGSTVVVLPLATLVIVAVVLAAVGMTGAARRDIA
jgi:ABC-2 type transport system permease protein